MVAKDEATARSRRVGALLSAGLFVLFAVIVGRAAVRDTLKTGGCGCFGARADVASAADTTAPRVIARNLFLAAFALAAAT